MFYLILFECKSIFSSSLLFSSSLFLSFLSPSLNGHLLSTMHFFCICIFIVWSIYLWLGRQFKLCLWRSLFLCIILCNHLCWKIVNIMLYMEINKISINQSIKYKLNKIVAKVCMSYTYSLHILLNKITFDVWTTCIQLKT